MTSSSYRTAAPAAPAVSGRTRALLGISLGYFMVLLDTTVLSVAEPDLARSLHSSVSGLQWTVNGYTVALAALLLSAGALADRYGAHRVFRAGIAVFGIGSLLSAAAPNLGVLIGLRVLLGVAAAASLPASMAMIVRLYPDAADRARALATFATVSGAALATGPIIGGVLVDLAGWRAIFLVNVPVAVLVLALTAISAVRSPSGDRPIDFVAQLAAVAVLGLLTDALIALGSDAVVHAAWSGAATLTAAVVLAMLERRSTAPALAPHVLRARGVAGGLAAGAAINFALTGALFVLPLLFQHQRQLGPAQIGLAFLPLTIPFGVNPLLTGRIVARVGARPPVLGGLCLLTAGGIVLGGAVLAGAPYPVLAIGLAMTGIGISFALPALVAVVATAAPEGAAGTAGGLLNSARQVGATLGVAAMGALVASAGPVRGGGYALLLAATVCALAILPHLRPPTEE